MEKWKKTLALNHDNMESRLEIVSADELRKIFKNQANVEVYNNIFDGEFIEAFRDTSLGKPLWKYFLIAALLFLLTEIALVRLMK